LIERVELDCFACVRFGYAKFFDTAYANWWKKSLSLKGLDKEAYLLSVRKVIVNVQIYQKGFP